MEWASTRRLSICVLNKLIQLLTSQGWQTIPFADDATPGLDDDEEADAEDVLDIPTDVATTVASPAVQSPVSPNIIDADAIAVATIDMAPV